ncbi:hypothetical protein C8N26_2453 [Tenacibaculum lutimaris]|uniref:Uncharacterized protein n=1 Tax=Tenacibaculum lutimaris TaxID=285258 RepID=A0A420DZE8_9FLAO|nr:hypothetical protein [Tenacibaculum lutimaris]RKF03077.1 hypothetical protein C8N26_2453 [Tenacibaculum lutimaris]
MNYGIYIIIGFIIVPLGILFAYYKDYKQNKIEFKNSIKTVGKGLINGIILLVIIGGLKMASEFIIPFNKDHGIEFNSEREKLGIPTVASNWKIDNHYSGQFETQWWKPNPRNGHFKKIIEYGIFNIKPETDYYQNENIKGTFAWSKYDFEKKTIQYFLGKPNEKEISVTESGKLKYGKPTIIVNINKDEFNNYITEK